MIDEEIFRKSPALAIAQKMFGLGGPPPDEPHAISRSTRIPPGSIRRALLQAGKPKVPNYAYDDPRPLIDLVQEASVRNEPGLRAIADQHAFRALLRKAHCFTLDANTSALVGDLSLAIAPDLDAARQMAIPPFPVTWFEVDNRARLERMKLRGIPLTSQAAGKTEAGEAVPRMGWLVTQDPIADGGYCLSYFTVVEEGVLMAPLAWLWHTFQLPAGYKPEFSNQMASEYLAFGMEGTGVQPGSFAVARSALCADRTYASPHEYELMDELAGELRHLFGLLVALSAGHAGLTHSTSPQAKPSGPDPVMPNGKPLFPLEHKHLHIHLGKKRSLGKVMAQIVTHHRKRLHDVRAHMRKLQSGRMVPVKSHQRGDRNLGVLTKDYIVER